MTNTLFPVGLSEIADKYDTILCDVWGVVHNGRAGFDSAIDALVRFRQLGKKVVLITNAPVPSFQVLSYMERIGVSNLISDDCVSSGDATRKLLSTKTENRVFIMGTDNDFEDDNFLHKDLGLTFVDAAESDLILCVGMRNPRSDEPEMYRKELTDLAKRNVPMICANPDIQVRVGDRLWWCAGALAQIYAEQGGSVVYPGKPHDAIYDAAYDRVRAAGGITDKSRVLAIGDGPITDLNGALNQGIDCVYVGTGLDQHGSGAFDEQVERLFDEHNVSASYAMPALTW